MQTILSKGKPPANSKKAVKAKWNKCKEEAPHASETSEQDQNLNIFLLLMLNHTNITTKHRWQ